MEFTDKEIRCYHEGLWDWLSKNPNCGKCEWPGWEFFYEKFDYNDECMNDCFLCDNHMIFDEDNQSDCTNCPLANKLMCDNVGHIFKYWKRAHAHYETTNTIIAARLIRDVFKRQDVRNG